MTNCHPNTTPCLHLGLGSDPDGNLMNKSWGYASIVGMLLYLSTNTRSEITFAVCQVARFTNAPRQSYATAVKSIIRYLKGSIDKGTILRPAPKLNVDAYVDAHVDAYLDAYLDAWLYS